MPDEHEPAGAEGSSEVMVTRESAEQVLRRVGYSEETVIHLLAHLDFPLPMSMLRRRGDEFGISTESLTEQLGGSP